MAAKRAQNRANLYDELINHLEGMYFQIPIMSFVDRHCFVFDPHQDEEDETRNVWTCYKSLVMQLLESFREDTGLTHDEVIKALSELDQVSDIHQMYKGLFIQVFATEDFGIFKDMMIQKNIELQQQLLLIILSQGGFVPAVLQPADTGGAHQSTVPGRSRQSGPAGHLATKGHGPVTGASHTAHPAPAYPTPAYQQPLTSEDAILAAVIRQSQQEHELSQKRREERDEAMVAQAILLSKHDAHRLQEQHEEQQVKLIRAVQDIAISDQPRKTVTPTTSTKKSSPVRAVHPESPMKLSPKKSGDVSESLGASASSVSGQEAASAWLSTALSDAEKNQSRSPLERDAGGDASEEVRKRAEYLKEQRDKLIQMKQKEREKQLQLAEQGNPVPRPSSARLAKSSLREDVKEKRVDDKELAMRRAIANKLKKEVISKDPDMMK